MGKAIVFLKTAAIYFIGNILTKMIGFFLLPLYTKRLLPSQFGEYDLIVALISFFIPVLFFQIWDGMFRFAFDKNEKNEKYNIITNSFFVFLGGLIVYSLIYSIIGEVFNFNFKWIIFIYGVSFALQYQYSFIARVFLKNKLFVFSGFMNSLISAISNIILIVGLGMGVEALYISAILGVVIQVVMIEIVVKPLNNLNIKAIDIDRIVKMIKFSIPLCVASISYWLLSGYTKLCIVNRLGAYENGLYAVANKFSIIVSLMVSIFQYAWNEMAYKMANDCNRIDSYKISIQYIFKVIIMGSAIGILGIKLIFPWFIDSSYIEALSIIPLVLIGVAFNSLAGFIGTIFMTEKDTKSIFITTIIAAFVNILCMNLFINLWELQGAVASLCLSFIILSFIRIIIIKKTLKIKSFNINIIYFVILLASIYIYYKYDGIIILLSIIFIILFSIINSVKGVDKN